METKYIQNDKQKKSLKNKINRESVICDEILNNLRYMYLTISHNCEVSWMVSWRLADVELFQMRWPISGLHGLSFSSKIAQACSNDGSKKVNRNVQHLFLPTFRPSRCHLGLTIFANTSPRPSWTEWSGEVDSSFWWHHIPGVVVGTTADLGHFKIIYRICFNNNNHPIHVMMSGTLWSQWYSPASVWNNK